MTRVEFYENGRKTITTNSVAIMGIENELGNLLNVIEGNLEVKRYFWNEAYEKLNTNEKQLIEIIFPEIITQITEKTHMPNKLLGNIYAWCLNKKSLRVICPRCNGTGEHSFNLKDGTKCYGCNGRTYILPRLSKKWLNLVKIEWQEHLKSKSN